MCKNRLKQLKRIYLTVLIITASLISNCICVNAKDSDTDILDTNTVTVCLDAGHDYKHTGASGFDLREEEINFKLAEYCKNYLEENSMIKVVMAHDTLECPYPDTPYEDCNYERCLYAKQNNADLYVSLHCNAESTGTSSGIHFIYPQDNWKPEFNISGLQFLECLKRNTTDYFDITKAYTRDSDDDEIDSTNFYPDETRADYYGVIRNCKYFNILGVIIEHGFITTESDAKILSDDNALKTLAIADAKSIMDYFTGIGIDVTKPDCITKQTLDTQHTLPIYMTYPTDSFDSNKNIDDKQKPIITVDRVTLNILHKYQKLLILPEKI